MVAAADGLRGVFALDEGKVQTHLDRVVRETVEQTLNALLDAEADELCGAKRYQRSADRVDTRAGSYPRALHTTAGEVTLKVPRLRSLPFETQIIERYRRRQSSVEEALVEMYLAGVSVRRVEDITEALWGTRVSASTVSELNQKIYVQIDAWRKAQGSLHAKELPRLARQKIAPAMRGPPALSGTYQNGRPRILSGWVP